jgi:2,3-bisphosphoglycerate-independent phosphoglycerate mutase
LFPDTLIHDSTTKILLCVLDGLGDIPGPGSRETPLEAAHTPNLDLLAAGGAVGLFTPVAAGVTPGSGPGHLALFGYDPQVYEVGRGVLSALGVDFALRPGDVAARFNFCSLDEEGRITDRRAGRLPTDTNRRLVDMLRSVVRAPAGIELFWETESEHRGVLVLRGQGLNGDLADTDPQQTGRPPLPVRALSDGAVDTARKVGRVIDLAHEAIQGEHPANGLLMRGFAALPAWPDFRTRFGMRAAAVAKYPMYRGVARLVGMHVLEPYVELAEAPARLKAAWPEHDFFFLHFKDPDKAGEDGDFDRKKRAIEAFDAIVPDLVACRPDVMVVTGDHSTPVAMRQHSWHPVPVLLHAPATGRPDSVERFGERWATSGGLGQRPMHELMSLALAHAGRMMKFGA